MTDHSRKYASGLIMWAIKTVPAAELLADKFMGSAYY